MELTTFDPEDRVPTDVAFKGLEDLVKATGDLDLGLRAGRSVGAGSSGPLEYALHSAPTLGRALELATKHCRLFDDALDLRLEPEGSQVLLRIESFIPRPKCAADFAV